MIAATITIYESEPECFYESCIGEGVKVDVYRNIPNKGVTHGLQTLCDKHKDENVIALIHSDVTIYEEGWSKRVQAIFDADPKVGVVGFGGATGIGTRDIYKVPYDIDQLARVDYYSNQRGWEIHGKWDAGVREVAVVDGFFMACRREMIREIGGWKWFPHRFHCYDTGMCLMAKRHGWKVMMVGVDVDHHGGGSSTKAEYFESCRELGTTPEREHWEPHKWMYEEFRKELPLRV